MLTEAQKNAVKYLAQVASDFCNSLPPSARGPAASECQKAIQILEAVEPPADA